jgi:hypothetical protein
MSCYCPSGYTPTIDFDDCILTITATTSGGSFFYTALAADNNSVYNELGVIFYENITNLSLPITNSGTTGSTTTENGTPLFSTEFLLDSSGRILNMQAGGVGTGINNDGSYGPTSIQNLLWGTGFATNGGRLNNAGVWASTGNPALPLNEWIGFSYCLDIVSGGTYFIGLSADNDIRLKVNNQLLVDCSASNFTAVTQSLTGFSFIFTNHHVFPITLTSGLNIIELEGLNQGQFAAFVAEIYSGNVSTLSGYTTYSQLSADTIFTTLDFIGQDIPLSSSGATTNTGYTCPNGYSLYTCSGTPYCIFIDKVGLISFCISDTGLGYDDNFTLSGTYNSEPYWSGDSTNRVIYLTTGGTWCLSDTLGGTCLLEGAYPCTSTCPDLCDTYFNEGVCPTPTPTPTVNCSVLDFTAIFDCEVTPTPSVTPTNTVTPTVTPTPSTTPLCPFIGVDVTITGYTPTPTPTPTITPTVTPIIDRPCEISGDVTYLTIDNEIICPVSRKFVDCANGQLYFTDSYVPTPSGDTLTPLLLFKANVDGISKCIVYVGLDFNNSGINSIQLVDGPLADLNLVEDCSSCTPDIPPTPTPSVTVTKTPTPTPTPTSSSMMGFYLYKLCSSNTYIIQTIPGPTTNNTLTFRTNASSSGECWEYISYSGIYPSLPPGATYSYITGNYFPTSGLLYFNNCTDCIFVTSEITPEG